jgi:hypothetical protein
MLPSTEKDKPSGECEEGGQTRIDHDDGPQLGIDLQMHKHLPCQDREKNAYRDAKNPNGKKRSKNVHRRGTLTTACNPYPADDARQSQRFHE